MPVDQHLAAAWVFDGNGSENGLVPIVGGATLDFTRLSEGAFYDNKGILQTAVADAARFDHDPVTRESLGLLIEGPRTNLVASSEDFLNGWSVTQSTATPNAALAPNGKIEATFFSGNDVAQDAILITSATTVIGNDYVSRVWARKGPGCETLLLRTNTAGSQTFFNLNTGVQSGGGGFISAKMTYHPAFDMWLCEMKWESTNTTGQIRMNITEDSGGPVWDEPIPSDVGIYVWGYDLQEGEFGSSYIKSDGAATTRAKDDCDTLDVSWYNEAESTIYCRSSKLSAPPATSDSLIEITDGTGENRWFLSARLNGNSRSGVTSGNVSQGNLDLSAPWNTLGDHGIAAAIGFNKHENFVDGVRTGTGLQTGIVPVGISKLNIGSQYSGNLQWNGHIREFRSYDEFKDLQFLTDLSLGLIPIFFTRTLMDEMLSGTGGPTIGDGLLFYFNARGGVGDTVQDAELSWLKQVAPTTEGDVQDLWMAYLGALGYEGALMDRLLQFWAFQGLNDQDLTVFWEFTHPNGLKSIKGGVTLDFDRISESNYFASDLLLHEAAVDIPRFEYDVVTGDPIGLLIEETRTTFVTNSFDATVGGWASGGGARRTGGFPGAIDGTDTLVEVRDAGTDVGPVAAQGARQNIACVNSGLHAVTFILKHGLSDWGYVETLQWDPQANGRTFIDMVNGVFGAIAPEHINPVIGYTAEGLIEVTFMIDVGADLVGRIFIGLSSANGNNQAPTDDTASLFLNVAQVEEGAFPTSLIRSFDSTTTRDSDKCTTADMSWYNQDQGTLYCSAIPSIVGQATDHYIATLSTGLTANRWFLGFNNVVQDGQAFMNKDSVTSFNLLNDTFAMANGQVVKMANAAIVNDFECYIDGNRILTGDQVGDMTVTPTILVIGANRVTSNQFWNGHVVAVGFYDKKKDDSFLSQITSP